MLFYLHIKYMSETYKSIIHFRFNNDFAADIIQPVDIIFTTNIDYILTTTGLPNRVSNLFRRDLQILDRQKC